jgi:hypothetical protein
MKLPQSRFDLITSICSAEEQLQSQRTPRTTGLAHRQKRELSAGTSSCDAYQAPTPATSRSRSYSCCCCRRRAMLPLMPASAAVCQPYACQRPAACRTPEDGNSCSCTCCWHCRRPAFSTQLHWALALALPLTLALLGVRIGTGTASFVVRR